MAKEYLFSNDEGDADITVYDVFEGVQLVYHNIHMNQLDLKLGFEGRMIEIHHCREGRIEQMFGEEYFYLTPGDLSIAIRTEITKDYHFPLHHYHGISIGINMDVVSPRFWRLLEEVQVQPMKVAEALCDESNCFIIRSEKYIEHIFSELYDVPEHIRDGYFKVKILELMLVLSGKDLKSKQLLDCKVPKTQVQLANQVAAYLSKHIDQHIKIEELARRFNVSTSHLKSVFKGVFGVPVFAYMRIQRMQAAALLLLHTERSVMEIANEFGYNNSSKFTAAFREVMGKTPSEYRKTHQK